MKKLFSLARLLAPLALPLIYRGLTSGRQLLSANEESEQALRARITAARTAIDESDKPKGFQGDAHDRLDQLENAIADARSLPAKQRAKKFLAISRDIKHTV